MSHTHKHHIIPKHMGGTDDSSNIIELSVEEHAEAHKALYEEFGRWQDFLAWKGLTGEIEGYDLTIQKISNASKESNRIRIQNGTHHLIGGKLQKQLVKEGKHHFLGGKHVKQKVKDGTHNFLGGEIQRKSNLKRTENGTHNFLGPNMNKKMFDDGTHPTLKEHICPHCNKKGKAMIMFRWHFDNCKLLDKTNKL